MALNFPFRRTRSSSHAPPQVRHVKILLLILDLFHFQILTATAAQKQTKVRPREEPLVG
jgi:hypothetical protein